MPNLFPDPSLDPSTGLAPDTALARLDDQLVSQGAIDRISQLLRDSAYVLEPDDQMLLSDAADLQVIDADAYTRGFQLLNELSNLGDRIEQHYDRFGRPLLTLTRVVRECKNPQVTPVAETKQTLARRLGKWKADDDARALREQQERQATADAKAQAEQAARAEVLRKLAEAETNAAVAASLQAEAEQVASVEVKAAPVEIARTATGVSGYQRVDWKCRFDDVKTLLTAYVEGRCHLNEDDLIAGLQASMDKQATVLQGQLGKAFPGTTGYSVPRAVGRRR